MKFAPQTVDAFKCVLNNERLLIKCVIFKSEKVETH